MDQARKDAIRAGVIARLKREGRYTGDFVKTPKRCVKCDSEFKPVRASQKFCSVGCSKVHLTPEDKAKASSMAVSKRRRLLKKMAVEHLGGKCVCCGYSRCIEALEFHHKDPSQKDFSVSGSGATRSWELVKAEIEKCALLCANCHREVHAGLIDFGA